MDEAQFSQVVTTLLEQVRQARLDGFRDRALMLELMQFMKDKGVMTDQDAQELRARADHIVDSAIANHSRAK